MNRRQITLITTFCAAILLIGVVVGGLTLGEERLSTNLDIRNASPSLEHPFGTDHLGRDMLTRTLKGLTVSIGVGVIAAAASAAIALVLGMLAATMGKAVDAAISWLIDLFLGVPHLVALILISFTLGGGLKGVVAGIALTHWPSLARIIRAEVMQLRSAEYVQISRRLGKSRWWVASRHILPHLFPQLLVGLVLLFPHAILHEASISFLGFGLSPHQPAIGIILSESMRYLTSGMWWLAFFPGISLLIIVRAFDTLGDNLRLLTDPHRAHQ
ncbi:MULTISPECIES: ABC transporter permease [Brevibacillus]|uniref:ABC transporter permease n=1 Tax=Brevibacillus TaxID=55080 RepID=UPI000F096078|nr:ABC transporter permease [Brevibacillus borstelensis]MCM3472571.1 ABC transporter permease [Brevibacillus borstelensis]MCM3593665.1 ABC transporter permease [Brevibacillus borstelensis]MCM3625433.1 ABC transporter permease [Brevibacillus borstelensis]MED1745050.1 ABC transporter permease [Brevibacillus borstelensis]MED1883154.1 ABC transporter permease [Brevibacillus borstelensis]